jgi:photosystem II stability/assembly factor-like uncharacterized protein
MLTLHRWLGLVAGLMILVAAGTAIGLNHQDLLLRPVKAEAARSPFERYMLSAWADPADASRVLVGTSDGLFRSLDGGKSWEEAVLNVPAEQVVALVGDPSRPGTVYAAFRAIGVFRSTDGGDLWEEVPLPFSPSEGPTVQGLAVTGAGALLVTTPKGLYRQAGADWAHVPAPVSEKKDDARKGLQLVYDLHDGKFWGTWGVPITDAVSVALIVLVLSGYVIFFGRVIKVRLARRKRRLVSTAPVSEAVAP